MTPKLNQLPGQLRDIHLPDAVSWWPPAPGWWILLVTLLFIGTLLFWLYTRQRQNRWRKVALIECARLRSKLQVDDNHKIASAVSSLLRRIAITRFPHDKTASLTGNDWLAFLDQAADNKTRFQQQANELLLQAPYQQSSVADVGLLLSMTETWIKALPGGKP